MIISNPNSKLVNLRVVAAPQGGGPNEWLSVDPYGSCSVSLPPNTLWQLECRLAGSQLISTVQVTSNAEVELTIVGARVRAEVGDHQPIQV